MNELIVGPPTVVNVSVHVITISAISEVSMDYTLDLYLRQFWHDSRLMFEAIQDHDNLTGRAYAYCIKNSILIF